MTYTYETLDGEMTFEIQQGMNEPHLKVHPELGVPIKRVITGGCGFALYSVKTRTPLNHNDYKDSKFAANLTKSKPVSFAMRTNRARKAAKAK